LIVVDRLAGGDMLKWNDVLELPAVEFLNYASYQVEKNKHESFEIKRRANG